MSAVHVTSCPKRGALAEGVHVILIELDVWIIRLKRDVTFPGVPVTVIGYVPAGVLVLTAKVITLVHVGEQPWPDIDCTVVPWLGRPETFSVTGCVVPLVRLFVIVF